MTRRPTWPSPSARLVGPDCLISAGIDLHGNVSARLVEQVDLFTAHRLAPHEDALLTRERACANLIRCLDAGAAPARAPGCRSRSSCPASGPAPWSNRGAGLYAGSPTLDWSPGVIDASLWVGYVWADQPRSGASAVVTGTDAGAARARGGAASPGATGTRDTTSASPRRSGNADWCIAEAAWRTERHPIVISDSGRQPDRRWGRRHAVLRRAAAGPPGTSPSGARTAISPASPTRRRSPPASRPASGGRSSCRSVASSTPIHAQPLAGARQGRDTATRTTAVGGRIAVRAASAASRSIAHLAPQALPSPARLHRARPRPGDAPRRRGEDRLPGARTAPPGRRRALLALTPGAVDQDIPAPDLHPRHRARSTRSTATCPIPTSRYECLGCEDCG